MTFTDESGERPGRRGGDPVVPGIFLRHRHYDAGAGEVWSGRAERLGTVVTVRYVRLPADPLLRAEAVDEARRQLDVRHPHLAAVTGAIPTPDGLAVVSEPVEETISLSRLLAARGRLDPGEVVTIGLPVAQALAVAHEAGLVHGELTALDILLEANGRPLLTGTGIAGLTSPGLSTADDVRDLADLLLGAMRQATGPDAAAVAVAVALALVDDPRRRPSAAELAAGLARSTTPLPVRMTAVPADAPVIDVEPLPDDGWGEPTGASSGHGEGEGEQRDDPWATGPEWQSGRIPEAATGDADLGGDLSGGEPAGLDPAWDDPRGAGGPARQATAGEPQAEAAHEGGSEDTGAGSGWPRDGRTAPSDPSQLVGALPPTERERRPRPPRSGGRAGRPATGRAGRPAASGRRGAPGGAGHVRGRGAGRDGGRGGAGRRAGGTARSRLLLPVVGCVGLVAVVIAAVLMSGGGPEGSEGRPAAATAGGGSQRDSSATPVNGRSPEQAWRAVLDELNSARSAAFERADPATLAGADAPGSPALSHDEGLIGEMRERGVHATPVRVQIVDLVIRSESADEVVLRVTESIEPYDFVDAAGTVQASEPRVPPSTRDLTLRRTEGGWRLASSASVAPG
ncbi:protein kinase [Parafrankia elaeagni]|uniref:protein kinase n=1 Tax=Parafrankia elaeagni TaxID=222534 RepID=UPI0003A2476A|nr:protein kinase [Parafrankia elaeagni]